MSKDDIYIGVPLDFLVEDDFLGLETVPIYDRYTGEPAGKENLSKRVVKLITGEAWETPNQDMRPHRSDQTKNTYPFPAPHQYKEFLLEIDEIKVFAAKETSVTMPGNISLSYLENKKADVLAKLSEMGVKVSEDHINLYFPQRYVAYL